MAYEHELFKQAVDKWGREPQIDMMIEECSELIKALCKLKRAHHPSDTGVLINDICEELADVQIMAGQMRYIFGSDEVDGWVDQKIERLQKLLNKYRAGETRVFCAAVSTRSLI